MGEIEAARERYAQEFAYTAHLTSAAVLQAFARVPRERYLGPGPWRIFQPFGPLLPGPRPTPIRDTCITTCWSPSMSSAS